MNPLRFLTVLSCLCVLSACSSAPSGRATNTHFAKTKHPVTAAKTPEACAPCETPSAPPSVHAAAVAPAAPAPVPAPVPVAPTPPPPPRVVEPVPTPPAVVAAPDSAPAPFLNATRTGNTVKLTWALPVNAGGYRSVEVMRNTSSTAQGRSRVRALRASVTELEDTAAPAGQVYWYWIKLTAVDGSVSNMGPTEAK